MQQSQLPSFTPDASSIHAHLPPVSPPPNNPIQQKNINKKTQIDTIDLTFFAMVSSLGAIQLELLHAIKLSPTLKLE